MKRKKNDYRGFLKKSGIKAREGSKCISVWQTTR